jgi:hypothetical protein
MVFPFSMLGVCGGNALADTVAGIVNIQNAPAATNTRMMRPRIKRRIRRLPA